MNVNTVLADDNGERNGKFEMMCKFESAHRNHLKQIARQNRAHHVSIHSIPQGTGGCPPGKGTRQT